jgi:atypical dual specificity phosphatase
VRNFSWLLEGRLAGLGFPDPEDAEALREEGITRLVSLSRRRPFREDPEGIAVLHLPVADMTAPTQAQLAEAVAFLAGALRRGGRAAVHCTAGWGRTGTVLAAWLVAEGADPYDAVERVRAARPGSIETPEQEQAVHRFARARAGRKEPR